MAKMRSPNCPQITFEEAAQKGRSVYQKEHTHAAPKEVVATDLGYGGLNGRSLTIIGALRQYGILEASGEGLRVSEDAVTYFELIEGSEWEEAVRRMVYHPPLFDSLRVQFGDALPSEATLKHHLIKQGFLPRAAEEVLDVYRANQLLFQGMSKRQEDPEEYSENVNLASPIYALPTPNSPVAIQSFSFALSPEAKADLQIRGVIGLEELELLRDHVELTIRALTRAQKAKPISESTRELHEGQTQIVKQLAAPHDGDEARQADTKPVAEIL